MANLTAEKIEEMQGLVDTMVDECFDQPDALSCLIGALDSVSPELEVCKPRLVLFTQEGCAHCAGDKEFFAPALKAGQIEEVSADDPSGNALMAKNDLDMTPTLALLDCNGKLIVEIDRPT